MPETDGDGVKRDGNKVAEAKFAIGNVLRILPSATKLGHKADSASRPFNASHIPSTTRTRSDFNKYIKYNSNIAPRKTTRTKQHKTQALYADGGIGCAQERFHLHRK